jgi:hypothetical protein
MGTASSSVMFTESWLFFCTRKVNSEPSTFLSSRLNRKIENHRLHSFHLACGRTSPVSQSRGLTTAILFASLHHAKEPPDSIHLLASQFTEVAKSGHQFVRDSSLRVDLLLNLLDKLIKLNINLK